MEEEAIVKMEAQGVDPRDRETHILSLPPSMK